MAQIRVSDLTFCYEGSFDNVFEDVSFCVDTDWKLGFIGRNGKGKTTFLNLLQGKMEYRGSITAGTAFDYFPYPVREEWLEKSASELTEEWKSGCEQWKVICELEKLKVSAEALYRSFGTLSQGERTKIMLAVLFSGNNEFLLIDEPTNHLDQQARENVKEYLRGKKGFILVSHDRDLLDACVDHVLVLNRKTIEIQNGNFSVWWENKERRDHFAQAENEKHLKEIDTLKRAADRSRRWAEKSEGTKIGFDPTKEHDRSKSTRAYIGAKTKKMQSRVFELRRGERVFLHGKNGCGKSSLIRAILNRTLPGQEPAFFAETGNLTTASGLIVSHISQDTSFLRGDIRSFCRQRGLDESLFCAILRQLDMERVQFVKRMEDFSEGQKKKVLIAASLLTPAHLYIWDEPLNYIDVFSRMQIEKLIEDKRPTLLAVEHDVRFREKTATRVVEM